jgi:hypothetical protein
MRMTSVTRRKIRVICFFGSEHGARASGGIKTFEPDESFFGQSVKCGKSQGCRGGREGEGGGGSGNRIMRAIGDDEGGGEAARGVRAMPGTSHEGWRLQMAGGGR